MASKKSAKKIESIGNGSAKVEHEEQSSMVTKLSLFADFDAQQKKKFDALMRQSSANLQALELVISSLELVTDDRTGKRAVWQLSEGSDGDNFLAFLRSLDWGSAYTQTKSGKAFIYKEDGEFVDRLSGLFKSRIITHEQILMLSKLILLVGQVDSQSETSGNRAVPNKLFTLPKSWKVLREKASAGVTVGKETKVYNVDKINAIEFRTLVSSFFGNPVSDPTAEQKQQVDSDADVMTIYRKHLESSKSK